MINIQNTKAFVAIKQTSATNGATITSDTIDTLGYNYCKIQVYGSTSDAATNNPSTLKVQESDSDTASNFADITALVGDGTGGFTVPNSPTATTNSVFADLNFPVGGIRKRYLRILITPLTSQTYTAIANLSRGETTPTGTTAQNAAVVVNA